MIDLNTYFGTDREKDIVDFLRFLRKANGYSKYVGKPLERHSIPFFRMSRDAYYCRYYKIDYEHNKTTGNNDYYYYYRFFRDEEAIRDNVFAQAKFKFDDYPHDYYRDIRCVKFDCAYIEEPEFHRLHWKYER